MKPQVIICTSLIVTYSTADSACISSRYVSLLAWDNWKKHLPTDPAIPLPTLALFSVYFAPRSSLAPLHPSRSMTFIDMSSVTKNFKWYSCMYVMLFEFCKISLNLKKILFQILLILIQDILTKNFLMRTHYCRSKQSLCGLGLCVA